MAIKVGEQIHERLRRRILSLSGVTERQNAGVHEDAFFVGRTMFMHIHGYGKCHIRLPKDVQARVLADGKAGEHRWAPQAGFVAFGVRDEGDLEEAMELVQTSHDYFANSR